jgi:hypothetical protein
MSDYGAISYHWKGRFWFINLYIWRRGPWRLVWAWYRWKPIDRYIETWIMPFVLSDILWGLHRRAQTRGEEAGGG